MQDLFADLEQKASGSGVVAPVSSGEVPRTFAGLTWGAKEEARFVQLVAEIQAGKLAMGKEDAIREARWVIEADMTRKFWGDEIRLAKSCLSDNDKRRVFAGWIEKYGRDRAEQIAMKARLPEFSRVAEKWR